MKKVYLLLLFCCLSLTNFATTWYSSPAGGDPSVLTSWWDSPTGTGANPTNFLSTSDSFVVQSAMNTVAATVTWTVYGSVNLYNGSIANNGTGTGFGGSTMTLNFRGNLYMNNNSFITSNYTAGTGMFGSGGIGGAVTINLYADLYMAGTAYITSAYATALGGYGGPVVTFANTASTLASPQHLSGIGSQALTEFTTWTVATGVHVQLVNNFNTEPPTTVAGFGGGPSTTTPYPFTVNGTIDCQNYNFNGPGAVTISAGGTMYTANATGIDGSIITTGTNLIDSAGNYVFNGTTPQVTGSLLPARISTYVTTGFGGTTSHGSLTINNPSGVTLSQSTTMATISVTGFGPPATYGTTVNVTSGNLSLGSFNLSIGYMSTLTGIFSNSTKVVTDGTGALQMYLHAAGVTIYPVGDVSNYTPITINMTGTITAGTSYVGVIVSNTAEPHNANTNDYLNRYWNIILSGITSPSYTVTSAQYATSDVVGAESGISAGAYPSAIPWLKYGSANTTSHTLSSTAITSTNVDFSGITTAAPTVSITPSANVCIGTPATLAVLSSTADAPATYSWSPAAGLSTAAGTTVTATPTVTTTYTVTVTDGNGFKGTSTSTITVNPAPGAITGAGADVLCLGQTLALSDTPGTGTWSSTDAASASVDGSGNVTALTAGTPTIIYTLPSSCNASVTLTVVAAAAPIGGSNTVCTGANTTLTDIGAGTWSSSSLAQATIDPTLGTIYGITPGSTVVTYTLAPGCSASETITVNSTPPGITGPPNACIGVTSDLADPVMGGTWASSNPSSATVSATGGVTGVATGSTTIIYALSTGCFVTYAMNVVELPPTITGTTSVCAGFSTPLADGVSGGTWSSGNTALATVDPVTGLTTGVYPGTPSIIYTLLPGCSTSIPFVVNASGTPAMAIAVSPSATVCPGTLADFSIASTAFTGTTPVYDWFKDGILVAHGTTYSYVPAAGDVVYGVLRSDFACRRTDSAISNNISLSIVPVVTPLVTISAVNATASKGVNDTLVAVISSTPAPAAPLYQWYKNDIVIPGATDGFYVINDNTTETAAYNCLVNSGNACNTTGISNRLYVTVSDVSVKQIAGNGNELNIAPNPNNGTFNLNLQSADNGPVQVVIMNLLGEKVNEFTTTTNTTTNVHLNVPAGVYLLSANTDNGRYVARIVVN